jgi:hypothetical protein
MPASQQHDETEHASAGRCPTPAVIADKLAIAQDACAKGRTAENAARLVGCSRATLYRDQQARAARESTTT